MSAVWEWVKLGTVGLLISCAITASFAAVFWHLLGNN
jgi:hypothetical protein